MKSCGDPYEEALRLYISLIKQDSSEAGTAIEQLHHRFGSRAALRATLVIQLLKMSIKEKYSLPDLILYEEIIQAYPEARPLLEQAIASSCCAWGAVDLTTVYRRST